MYILFTIVFIMYRYNSTFSLSLSPLVNPFYFLALFVQQDDLASMLAADESYYEINISSLELLLPIFQTDFFRNNVTGDDAA